MSFTLRNYVSKYKFEAKEILNVHDIRKIVCLLNVLFVRKDESVFTLNIK
jgi:hypothetical protein